MANGDQLKALFRSYAEGDDRHFYSVAMQMAAHEAKQGHGKLAEELRDLLDAAKSRRNAGAAGAADGAIPLARPKGELASLLSVSYPSTRLEGAAASEQAAQPRPAPAPQVAARRAFGHRQNDDCGRAGG